MSEALDPAALIGAWELRRFAVQFSDGRPTVFPFGENAQGRILYEADGHMLAVLSRRERKTFDADGLESAYAAPPEQKARAFDEYLSYGGRWELRGSRVVHHVEVSLAPNAIGASQEREVKLEGEGDDILLTLSYELPGRGGSTKTYELCWRRPKR